MSGLFWFAILCFLWLIGLVLLAEILFYEEEQEL